MKDNRFDDIVRSKLSDLKSDSTPKWNQFLEKKKAEDLVEADMYFDKNVRNSISKHRVEYNANHWTLLKARINYLANLKNKINGLKSLELAALFLILFVSYSNLDHKAILTPNEPLADLNNNKVNSPTDKSTLQKSLIDIQDNISKDNTNNSVNNLEKTIARNANSVSASNVPASNEITRSLLVTSKNISQSSDVNAYNKGISVDSYDNNSGNSMDVASNINNNSTPLFPPVLSENETTLFENAFLENLISINATEPTSINYQRATPSIANNIEVAPLQANTSWIHIITSFDNNLIFTPDDLAYNTTSRKTEMFGFTFGALYSRLLGRWELETGLTTSTYSKPWDFTQQYGNFNGWYKYSLTNIENNFVGIPLQVKYHFLQNVDWSIFGKTGFTSEFVVNSEYTSNNQYLGGVPAQPGSPPLTEHSDAPFEEDHNFSKGLFQGGSINDNLFVRANIGLGLERNITSNLSVYFSSEYHMNVVNKHIGPNNDKINKFGFIVGVKMLLK